MIVVVIPAYNEAKTIGSIVTSLLPLVDKVIVVDDGSQDGTGKIARASGALVLRHLVNRDYGAAIITGTMYALKIGADFIVHFDADGQFEAEELPKILKPLLVGRAEVTLGSRFLGKTIGLPITRRLILKGAILFTWFFSGVKLTDAQNGFRGFTRQAASMINFSQERKALTSEILHEIGRLRLPYEEVPITVHYTNYSLNKAKANSVSDIWRIIRDLFIGKVIR